MKILEIYTDGGCQVHDSNLGSWAYVITEDSVIKHEASGNVADSTNNRMELTAVINALEYCKEHDYQNLVILTDSQYVCKGITSWITSWVLNNWKNSKNKPVLNKDLWVTLLELQSDLNIVYKWVKGHGDNEFNNRADFLCNQEYLKQ